MRVAFLSHTALTGTGPGEALLHLARGLSTRPDLALLVLLPADGPLADALRADGIAVRLLSSPLPWYMWVEGGGDGLATYLSTARAVAEEIGAVVSGWGAEAIVINTHTSLSGLLAAASWNLPYLLWIHGVIDSSMISFPARELKWACDELMIRCADARVCASRCMADSIRSQYGCAADVVPNMTYVPAAIADPAPGTTLFCCLNSWEPHKRVDTLIDAAAILRRRDLPFSLFLHGAGPVEYTDQLRGKIAALGLDGIVHLKGRTENPREVLRGSHALVSASQIEPFGMTLIEAMSEGRPVIASATGGHREIIRDGLNGFLCPVGDAEAFADRMEWVIRNRDEAAETGRRGWDLAQREYSGKVALPLFSDALQAMVLKERAQTPDALRDRYWPCRLLLAGPTARPEAEVVAPVPPTPVERRIEDLVIGPDLTRRPLQYRIHATADALAGVSFQIGTHRTTPRGALDLRIYAGGRTLLRVARIDLGGVPDNSWCTVHFAPIANSGGRTFRLEAAAELAEGRAAIYEERLAAPLTLLDRVRARYCPPRTRNRRAFLARYAS